MMRSDTSQRDMLMGMNGDQNMHADKCEAGHVKQYEGAGVSH